MLTLRAFSNGFSLLLERTAFRSIGRLGIGGDTYCAVPVVLCMLNSPSLDALGSPTSPVVSSYPDDPIIHAHMFSLALMESRCCDATLMG